LADVGLRHCKLAQQRGGNYTYRVRTPLKHDTQPHIGKKQSLDATTA
jgi:hypothetical protein